MKFSSLIAAIPILGMATSRMIDYDVQLEGILNTPNLEKRASNNSLVPLIQTLAGSGLITSLLEQITSSQEKMDNVADLVLSAFQGAEDSILANLSIDVDTGELMAGVLTLLPPVADGLLLNETNRNLVAIIGSTLLGSKDYVWIPTLLLKLGLGSELSVDVLADLMINGTDNKKLSSFGKIEQANVVKDKRATENDGSLQLLVSNMLQTLLKSDLFKASTDQLFEAINESGVVVPLVLDVLTLPGLPKLIGTILNKLYVNHVFDNLDLNTYYVHIKETNLMSDVSQSVLTNEKYSPAIALLLKKIEDLGTLTKITKNMYGDLAKVPPTS
ncbi:hypothetical protein JA1_000420 [Spathaspora sp. JA1]|nr:hypothetical protein JA1_000420 [Spathaspora sp. JA1]